MRLLGVRCLYTRSPVSGSNKHKPVHRYQPPNVYSLG